MSLPTELCSQGPLNYLKLLIYKNNINITNLKNPLKKQILKIFFVSKRFKKCLYLSHVHSKSPIKHKPDPIHTPIYIAPLPNFSDLITSRSFHKHNTNTSSFSLSLFFLSLHISSSQFTNLNKLSYKNLTIPQFTYKITLFSNPSRFLHPFSDTNPNFSLINQGLFS